MIAGGYMVDSKKGNPALDMAMKLTIDDIDAAILEDAETNQKQSKIKEPEIGSYERIMQAFGGKLSTSPKGEGDGSG